MSRARRVELVSPHDLVTVHGSTARLHTTGAPILPLGYVAEFCRTFVPEQARHAPERGEDGLSLLGIMSHFVSVTLLASGIPLLAEAAGNVSDVRPMNENAILISKWAAFTRYSTPV